MYLFTEKYFEYNEDTLTPIDNIRNISQQISSSQELNTQHDRPFQELSEWEHGISARCEMKMRVRVIRFCNKKKIFGPKVRPEKSAGRNSCNPIWQVTTISSNGTSNYTPDLTPTGNRLNGKRLKLMTLFQRSILEYLFYEKYYVSDKNFNNLLYLSIRWILPMFHVFSLLENKGALWIDMNFLDTIRWQNVALLTYWNQCKTTR